jgi:EamA domain-containing membrane protein RarD
MTDLKDTIQVGLANGSAIGVSLVEANEILTMVSLLLAISFTIYKFIKYEKNSL